MNMSRRRGELSLETVLFISFALVIILSVLASVRFFYSQQPSAKAEQDITAAYDGIMGSLRSDARMASSCLSGSQSVTFFDKDNKKIAVYDLAEKSLRRTDAEGQTQVIAPGIEKAEFRLNKELSNLLHVYILPVDKMQIPFFTSFALRGVKNDK